MKRGLACVVAILATIAAVYITHPRDEGAFLAYVHRYGSYDGRPERLNAPDSTLIEAGDHACAWLARQPPALWRTGLSHRVAALFDAYRADMADGDRGLPSSVLPGAWAYLCPGTKYLVKPHYIFSDPSGD